MIPTEIANTNTTSQSSQSARGHLLQDYFKKFADFAEDQKLSKLCKDIGLLKKIEKGQFFITIEEGSEIMQIACREYTRSRNLETSRPKGWIRSNTKIGPVLDANLYRHEERYCIAIMIEPSFRDQTVSWVRIVNGINKYVTETSEEMSTESVDLFISTGKLVANGKPKPKYVVNSSINVPNRERKWTDIDPQPFDQGCFELSKFMTRTLRHDSSIPPDEDTEQNDVDTIWTDPESHRTNTLGKLTTTI